MADGHRNIGVTGKENDRDAPARRGKLLLKIQSAQSRHSNVKHKASGDGWRILVEKLIGPSKCSQFERRVGAVACLRPQSGLP